MYIPDPHHPGVFDSDGTDIPTVFCKCGGICVKKFNNGDLAWVCWHCKKLCKYVSEKA